MSRCLPRLVSKMAFENARYFNRQLVPSHFHRQSNEGFGSSQSVSTSFRNWIRAIGGFCSNFVQIIKREIYAIRYVYNFFYNLFIISRTNQVFYFFLYLPVLEHLKKSFVEVYIYEYMDFFRRTNYFFFFQAKLFDVRGIIIKIIY